MGKKAKPARRNATRNATPKKGRKPTSVPDWKPTFLEELARTCNVSAAAKAAKVNRNSAYAARTIDDKADPQARATAMAFAAQWDNALEVAIDALELEARRRALSGVLEPVGWYRGAAGGQVRRYSDTLMIVLLKAHRPEKYRDQVDAHHTGAIALVTTDEMAKARDAAEHWEQERFGHEA